MENPPPAACFNVIGDDSLKRIYGDNIFEIINGIKDNSTKFNNYLEKTSKEMSVQSSNFANELELQIRNQASKYAGYFNLNKDTDKEQESSNKFIQSVSSEFIQLIKKVTKMHSEIVKTIEENMEIMASFLEIAKNLEKQKPIQDFLAKSFKDIINSWLFMKIDIERFNFVDALKNIELEQNFKNFISKECLNKNLVVKISFPKTNLYDEKLNKPSNKNLDDKKKEYKKMLTENKKNLVKLSMENVDNVDEYIDDNDTVFEKLNNFSLENVNLIKNYKIKKINLKEK